MGTRACDVVIVGGGPAGSTCARDLTRAGCRVVILDRAAFPRDKTCAGWVTPGVWEAAGVTPGEYAHQRVVEPIRGFAVGTIGDARLPIEYGEVVSHAVRRAEFDAYLLERCGAHVVRHHVRHIVHSAGEWVIDDEWRAPWLVGAGGTSCPVARLLNPGFSPSMSTVLATGVEFEMPPREAAACPIEGSHPALFFADDRRGYGWCLRKGAFLNVGFGRLADDVFQAREHAFRTWLGATVLPGITVPARWPGHAYRLWALPARSLAADGVLLVGDAAGLADPVSGEGIVPAVESGARSARAILDARRPDLGEARGAYEEWLVRRFGARHRLAAPHSALAPILVPLTRKALASPWFLRHVLLDRWFLHRGRASDVAHDAPHHVAA